MPSSRLRVLTAGALVLPAAAAAVAVAAMPAADAATVTRMNPHGSVGVVSLGDGHGHGMSQWGAYGAALKGRSFRQILGFYYPHTTLANRSRSSVQVLLSGTGSALTVAAERGLTVSGVGGALPTAGVSRYRLVSGRGSTVTLQRNSTRNGSFSTVRRNLPSATSFSHPGGTRVFLSDGSSTRYLGRVEAVRSGGVRAVNVLPLDQYTQGVAPREMPASWSRAAVQAQAVAARTYARNAVIHSGGRYYDICDTTMCQVYGGHVHYYSNGRVAWRDDPAAVVGDRGLVMRYRGSAIFAQFSASNGGWMASGGEPYLVSGRDPYDAAGGRNPWTNHSENVSARSLASYFGLRTVTGVSVLRRDRNGAWGGRAVSVRVYGTRSNGRATSVTTSGENMQWALGLDTTLFRFVHRG